MNQYKYFPSSNEEPLSVEVYKLSMEYLLFWLIFYEETQIFW